MRLTICDQCGQDIATGAAVSVYGSVSASPGPKKCPGPWSVENQLHEGCVEAFLQARYPHVLAAPPGWMEES